jgi:hypothetical protein
MFRYSRIKILYQLPNLIVKNRTTNIIRSYINTLPNKGKTITFKSPNSFATVIDYKHRFYSWINSYDPEEFIVIYSYIGAFVGFSAGCWYVQQWTRKNNYGKVKVNLLDMVFGGVIFGYLGGMCTALVIAHPIIIPSIFIIGILNKIEI